MKYAFKDIAFNSTEKRIPVEEDRLSYIGLEHLGSRKLAVTRFGSDVPLKGEKLVMKKGDILFGKRNTYLKRVAIAPHDGLFSAHGMVLRPNEKVISKEFFPFFLSSDYFLDEAIRISVGSLSPTVNWKDLRDLEFEVPTFDEQHKLAQLLSAANGLKESYEKMIAATDEMVKSQFIEMFGSDSLENCKWSTKSFGELFEISSSRRILKDDWAQEGVPFLRVRDLIHYSQTGELKNEFFVSEAFYNKLKEADGKVQGGDILVSATSTIGKCLVVRDGERFYYKDADVLRFREKVPINKVFFVYGLSMPTVENQINDTIGKTTVGHFLISKAATIKQPLPPVLLQETFEKVVRQADKSKFELKQAIEKIDQMMRALMH